MPRRHLQSFGRVIVHEKLCCADYRRNHRMLVDHFVVFYVIDNDTVTVTDVLYGASDTHYRWKERHLS